MKNLAFVCILLFAVAGLATPHHAGRYKQNAVQADDVPQKAVRVYQYVLKHDEAPEGYVGGRRWENREHRLPAGGEYREYDVNPKIPGVNRGAERIIVDARNRKGWYTGDHYRTFILIPNQGK